MTKHVNDKPLFPAVTELKGEARTTADKGVRIHQKMFGKPYLNASYADDGTLIYRRPGRPRECFDFSGEDL
jgi:hypothetical protein